MLGKPTVLIPREGKGFVETPYVKELTERALSYLKAGFPVHLSGPAGVGKTTLAFHIAAKWGRPTVLIAGDYEFGTSDLVGGIYGFRRRYTRDNFIRTVLKTDESMTQQWIDNRLTTACQCGLTLIYDEFTRSRPEANNVLLSVLEEGVLVLATASGKGNYLKVEPDFRAIFTSNPEEYAGVQPSQDALRDRMVTIELGEFDEETEVAITQAKAGLPLEAARWIVGLVRTVRAVMATKRTPTVRACIMIGKVLQLKGATALGLDGHLFRQICLDILMPEVPREERAGAREVIEETLSTWGGRG
jgi:gas vesicle protein GvpN